MRLAVFGATGATGLHIVREALERGYDVRALVRNVPKMEALMAGKSSEGLEIVEVNLMDVEALTASLKECAAVMCALGASMSCTTITFMQEAITNVVEAMRRLGIPRLIVCSSMFSKRSSENPFIVEWFFKPLIIGRNTDDFFRMETFLASDCQDICYTVVKPPQLNNGLFDGRTLRAVEGDRLNTRSIVPRIYVARFMLDCLKIPDWDRKLVSIGF